MGTEHIAKVTAAIDFIEEHLNEKLDLSRVAEAVHYSKYHLHRVFAETVGLTIHSYIQRRQLTEAAKLLVFSRRPIVEIAAVAGYESQQAFTNTFSALYKQPPNRYRENERFYPLQLTFRLEGDYDMLRTEETAEWNVTLASEEDIPAWMELVRLVIDGFPHLQEDEYILTLRRHIESGQALILKDGSVAVGAMIFSFQTGSIDFFGTHPLYRNKGVPGAFLDKVMELPDDETPISITTYREGDKADTGHRKAIERLGFAEAELLIEFGYPTQRFILDRKVAKDD